MIAKRILLAVTAILAASVLALVGVAMAGNAAQAQDILPPAAPAPPTLGNPVDLTAATAGRGEVNVSFSPAAGATVHWVWRVRYDNTDGAWVKASSGGVQTVTGLKPGAGYYFIVIAGRPQVTGSGMQWSSWSNWGAAAAGTTAGRTSSIFPANPVNGDYDHDDDGLIEIRSITQLDAIRHDQDGNGVADANSDDDDVNAATAAAYAAAFPNAATGMGCPDDGCAGYELAASLDFQTGEDSGAWVSIRGYAADFDGNGLTISNLFINESSSSSVGLFGWTTSGSTVRRVGLEAANVIGNDNTGGLVGHNSGDIIDCYVKGSVSGDDTVGGLVGHNAGAVTKSYADATVLGRYGDSDNIGGLVGYNHGNINNSYAEGAVSGDDSIGGLVGYNDGVITASYATAIASGHYYVGGLVGRNDFGSIAAAYATGAAAGHVEVGGLVGRNDFGSIAAAYATGTASRRSGYTSSPGGGGLVGYGSSHKTHHSYWDTETSGWPTSIAGTGRTTAQLQTPTSNTGIYSQWDPAQWDLRGWHVVAVPRAEGGRPQRRGPARRRVHGHEDRHGQHNTGRRRPCRPGRALSGHRRRQLNQQRQLAERAAGKPVARRSHRPRRAGDRPGTGRQRAVRFPAGGVGQPGAAYDFADGQQ